MKEENCYERGERGERGGMVPVSPAELLLLALLLPGELLLLALVLLAQVLLLPKLCLLLYLNFCEI